MPLEESEGRIREGPCLCYNTGVILRHRDRELLRFEWIRDARVRILSVNDAERRFLPLEFGEERLSGGIDALRYPLEDWLASRSAGISCAT